jgi:hypothetical protein
LEPAWKVLENLCGGREQLSREDVGLALLLLVRWRDLVMHENVT